MILNRQHRVRVPLADLRNFLARARRALRLPARSLTVCLVTDGEIARWNCTYRGKQGPTDVLSFPVDSKRKKQASPVPRQTKNGLVAATYLGDIAIAPAVARRNARHLGRAFGDEMRILILHGILHLMGYDHETDTGQMERREHRLRRALGLT